MAKIEVVCTANNVAYGDVRKAMCNGARTREDLKKELGVCGECAGCEEYLDYVLATCCGCKQVSMKTIVDLVQSGVKSLEEIMEKTGAGTEPDCGRCHALITNIIEQGY